MYWKRLLSVLLVVLLVIPCLSGCNQTNTEKSNINTAYFKGEGIWPEKDLGAYTAPEEATVTVNGVVYTGRYSETTQPLSTSPEVFYWYEGNGFRFRIGADDGRFYQLSLDTPDVEGCTLDTARGRAIADAIADDYLVLDGYTVRESMWETTDADHTAHTYSYYRTVNGIETTDGLSVTLNCHGELDNISLWQPGAFENVKSAVIDEEKINHAIENRLRQACSEIGLQYTRFEIRNTEWYLLKTEEDQCVLYFSIIYYYLNKEGVESSSSWLSEMMVVVDHEE